MTLPLLLAAQTGSDDFLRSTGRIYVVVAVIAIVFMGIIGFLVYVDRRLSYLEKQIKDK